MAVGQFDLGPAAAFSLVYLIILLVSWLFYTAMTMPTRLGHEQAQSAGPAAVHPVPAGADLLAAEHVVQEQHRNPRRPDPVSRGFTTRQLQGDLHRSSWYTGYINSLYYVSLNTVISCGGAAGGLCLSRYRFLGDKHLFFWLLTNRMAPPAVFLLPFFQLYSSIGLFDTHIAVALAHCLFNVPLAVWILEGFMSACRRRSTKPPTSTATAFRVLREDLHPADRLRHRRDGVFLLHVLLGRTAAGAHPDVGERQADRGGDDPHGVGLGHRLGRAGGGGVLTILPGMLMIALLRLGALPWAGCEEGDDGMDGLDLADRAVLRRHRLMLVGMTLGTASPEHGARVFCRLPPPVATAVHRSSGSAYLHLLVVGVSDWPCGWPRCCRWRGWWW
jgi:hypothetical protein